MLIYPPISMKVLVSLHLPVWCLRDTHPDGSGEEDARGGERVERTGQAGQPSGLMSVEAIEDRIG